MAVYTEDDFERMRDDPEMTRRYFWRVAMGWIASGHRDIGQAVLANIDDLVASCVNTSD